jgi:putative ABC transport system permease protein
MVTNEAPGARLSEAPMLRGRVVSLAGTPVEKLRSVPPEAQWVVNGDRGVTFASDVPAGSRLVEGTWWPKDYDGEPLVSFEVELAKKLGLRIGDSITVNVLGRDITARIANLREIKWENLTINFVIVFSPNTLSTAPYNLLATIALPEGTSAAEDARLIQKLTVAFPTATSVRVKDALETFGRIFEKIMVAVNVAGGVTLLSGALVLAGALATAQRRRIYQAVVLKTLGATRRRILAANLAEYALLASATGIIAALVGSVAAWIVVTRLMDLEFAFSVTALLRALALALGLVLVFGLTGTWRALSARPVPYLRAE